MADPINTKQPKPTNVTTGINLYNETSPFGASNRLAEAGIADPTSPFSTIDSITDPTSRINVDVDYSKDPSLVDAFKAGYESGAFGIAADINYLQAAFDSITGDEYGFQRNLQQAQTDSSAAAAATKDLPTFESLLEQPTFGNFFTQVAKGVGQITPSLVGAIGGGFTGAVIASLGKVAINRSGKKALNKIITDQVKKQAAGPLDKDGTELLENAYKAYQAKNGVGTFAKRGAQAGALGFSYPVSAGTSFGEFEDAGVELTPERAFQALAIGAPIAALDVTGQTIMAKAVAKIALKEAAKEGAPLGYKRLASDITKAFATAAPGEGVTEFLQEGINVAQRISVDDTYTKEQAQLRLAEAAFVGFFGGGAVGGAGGAAGSVFNQAKQMVSAKYDSALDAQAEGAETNLNDTTLGDPTPEAASDINAQVGVALSPQVGEKQVAFIPETSEETYRASENNAVNNEALDQAKASPNLQVELKGGGFVGYVPGRGFVVSANRQVVKDLQEANTSQEQNAFDEKIATYLGYAGTKPEVPTGVVQVKDKDGNVVFEEVVDDSTQERSVQAANTFVNKLGEGASLEVLPPEEVLAARARSMEIRDEDLGEVRDDRATVEGEETATTVPDNVTSVRLRTPVSMVSAVDLDETQLDINEETRTVSLNETAIEALKDTTNPGYQAARAAQSDLKVLLENRQAEIPGARVSSELDTELERIAPVKSRDSFNNLNKPRDGKVDQTLGTPNGYAIDNYAGRDRDPRKYFSEEGNSAFERLLDLFGDSPQADLLRRYKDYMSDALLIKLYDQKVAYPDLDINLDVFNTPTGVRFFITTEVDSIAPEVISYQQDNKTILGTANFINYMVDKMFNILPATLKARGARFVVTETSPDGTVVRQKVVPLSLIYALGRTLEVKRGEYLVEGQQSAGTQEGALRKLAIIAGLQAILAHTGKTGNNKTTISVLPSTNSNVNDAVSLVDIGKVDPIEETINNNRDDVNVRSYKEVMDVELPAPTPGSDYTVSILEDIAALEVYLNDADLDLIQAQPALFDLFTRIDRAYFETSIGGVVAEGLKSENFPVDYTADPISKLDIQIVVGDLQDRLNVVEQRESKELGTEDRITEETAPGVSGRKRPKLNIFNKILQDFKKIYRFKKTPRVFTAEEIRKLAENIDDLKPLFNSDKATPNSLEQFRNALLKELQEFKNNPDKKGFSFTQAENSFLKTSLIVVSSTDSTGVTALLHEMGHVVLSEQQESLFKPDGSLTKLGELLWNEYKTSAAQYSNNLSQDSFIEWYADQVASASRKKAQNGVDSYFKRIADLLKKIFDGTKRLQLNQTFEVYFDKVLAAHRQAGKKDKAEGRVSVEDKAIVDDIVNEVNKAVPPKLRTQYKKEAIKILRNKPSSWIKKFVEYAAPVTTFYRSLGVAGEKLANFWNKKSQTVGVRGFNNERVVVRNKLASKLETILGVPITQWSSDEVVNILKLAEDDTVATEDLTGKAKQVRLFFESLYDDYITNPETNQPWFEIGRLQDYHPRKLNLAGIAENPKLFRRLILEHVAKEQGQSVTNQEVIKQADEIVSNILQVAYQNEGVDIPSVFEGNGIEAVAMTAAAKRTLAALNTKTIREFEQANNAVNTILESPEAALVPYLYHIVKKVEFERRGGIDELTKLVNEVLDENHPMPPATASQAEIDQVKAARSQLESKLYASFDAQLGRNGLDVSDGLKVFNGVTTLWTALTTLAFTVFSSFTDFGAIVTRGKEFQNFADLIQDLRRGDLDEWKTLSKDLGVVVTDGIGTVWMSPGELDWQQKWATSALDKWFKGTLLTQYTNFTRTVAVGMGKRFIVNSALNPTERNTRYLAELGLTPEEVNQWLEESKTNGGIPSYESAVGKKIADGIREFADESIIRPDPGQRPNWANSPYFQVVFSLKSFFYSYGTTVLGGIGREMKNRYAEDGHANGAAMLLLLTAGFMLPLAMVGLESREWLKYLGQALLPGVDAGGDVFMSDHMSTGEYIPEIVDRAGLLGPWTIVKSMYDGFVDRGDNPFVSQIPFVDMLDQTLFEGNIYRGIPVLNNLGIK